jgi:hypothetical protein
VTALAQRLPARPPRLAALPQQVRALPQRLATLARQAPPLAREHWLLALLLTAGLVLRVLAQVAYRPALFYIDSLRYLYDAHGADPVGYRVLLKPLLLVGNLDLVAAVQHVLGLAMAVALYIVLQRRGVPRWLSALATAPILLDAYQLQIEQTIMPDVMFEACIVAGLAALLWQPRPRTALIITGGLALGASATARQVGEILILPALAYLLISVPHWRRRLAQGAILCAAFALPILAYCSVALAVTGHFRLSYTGTNEFYGRLALAVDCREVALPTGERALCPSHARACRRQRARSGSLSLAPSPPPPVPATAAARAALNRCPARKSSARFGSAAKAAASLHRRPTKPGSSASRQHLPTRSGIASWLTTKS